MKIEKLYVILFFHRWQQESNRKPSAIKLNLKSMLLISSVFVKMSVIIFKMLSFKIIMLL